MSLNVVTQSNLINKTDFVVTIDKNQQVSIVPKGWKRVLIEGNIVYYSPSQQILSSLNDVSLYLQKKGTCKCGLNCPLFIEEVFNFDPLVQSIQIDEFEDKSINNLSCNHKKKRKLFSSQRNFNNINHSDETFVTNNIKKPKNLISNLVNNKNEDNSLTSCINQSINDQNLNTNKEILNFPISIQSLLNSKPNDSSGQIFGYIPIKIDSLNNLNNFNLLNQPIIVKGANFSPTKINTTTLSPVIQIINSPMILSSATVITVQPQENQSLI